jgi:hypothetical protein
MSGKLFDKDELHELAIKAANGLDDFGSSDYLKGLDVLLDSISKDSHLSPMGEMIAQSGFVGILNQRLRVHDHIKHNPQVLEEKIERPIFVIGPARSGTTITHYLLAQDSRHRVPYVWESFDFYPPLKPETLKTDPRIAAAEQKLAMVEQFAPRMAAAHPITAWDAQECVSMHALEFHSYTFAPQYQCHSYQYWLEKQDLRWVYERQKLMMQFMQSGGVRGERWLLKSPAHLGRIDEILAVFPDALIIQTHREPTEAMVSLASLQTILQEMAVEHIDFKSLAPYFVDRLEATLKKNIEQRKRYADKPKQFFDLHMLDTIRDPVGCVKAAYAHFDLDLPGATAQKMQDYMHAHSLEVKGKHEYNADDFGFDIPKEWPRFDFYRNYFHLEEKRQ